LVEALALALALLLLLLAVLRIIALLIVLLLLLLSLLLILVKSTTVWLAGLERLGARLERSDSGSKCSLSLSLARVHIELLLSSAGQVFVLSGGIVFPRVKVRHFCWLAATNCSRRILSWSVNGEYMTPRSSQVRLPDESQVGALRTWNVTRAT
jgi:hypothetical protein